MDSSADYHVAVSLEGGQMFSLSYQRNDVAKDVFETLTDAVQAWVSDSDEANVPTVVLVRDHTGAVLSLRADMIAAVVLVGGEKPMRAMRAYDA